MDYKGMVLMHLKLSIDLKRETLAHFKLIEKIEKLKKLSKTEGIGILENLRKSHLEKLLSWRMLLDELLVLIEEKRFEKEGLEIRKKAALKLKQEELKAIIPNYNLEMFKQNKKAI